MNRWLVIAILIAFLAGAVYVGYRGWTGGGDVDMPASAYVALALGVIFSLLIGCGLMALVFYSHRKGYDDRVDRRSEDEKR